MSGYYELLVGTLLYVVLIIGAASGHNPFTRELLPWAVLFLAGALLIGFGIAGIVELVIRLQTHPYKKGR